jgi:hypothetical protein
MPRIPQDFFKQMGKQATPKKMGMAGAVGGFSSSLPVPLFCSFFRIDQI